MRSEIHSANRAAVTITSTRTSIWSVAIIAILSIPTVIAQAADCDRTLCLGGFVAGSITNARSPESWLAGGFGRLETGSEEAGQAETATAGEFRLLADWNLHPNISIHAHGVARWEPDAIDQSTFGATEAFVEARWPADALRRVRVRAGAFFLPTSRENTGPGWTSPYTLTLSALNTWIGEEVRPAGVDVEYRTPAGEDLLSFGATAFRGNDTMGALLAWRGWAFGNRLTSYTEVLPLPPIWSLSDPTAFGDQRDDGTKPFGRDLDGKTGWSGRVRWQRPERALIQITHLENGGDRLFYRGEYSWETSMDLVGAELLAGEHLTFASEVARGETGMGRGNAFVQADFRAAYLLASARFEPMTFTVRYDDFETVERDFSRAESNDEDGTAWTAALLWNLGGNLRLGFEFIDVDAQRAAITESGYDLDKTTRAFRTEIRWSF